MIWRQSSAVFIRAEDHPANNSDQWELRMFMSMYFTRSDWLVLQWLNENRSFDKFIRHCFSTNEKWAFWMTALSDWSNGRFRSSQTHGSNTHANWTSDLYKFESFRIKIIIKVGDYSHQYFPYHYNQPKYVMIRKQNIDKLSYVLHLNSFHIKVHWSYSEQKLNRTYA